MAIMRVAISPLMDVSVRKTLVVGEMVPVCDEEPADGSRWWSRHGCELQALPSIVRGGR